MPKSEHFANIMVQCFIDAVSEGIDLVPVVADSTSTSKIKPFMEAFPGRIVNVGIAEQAMVGAAAGLAAAGKVAVTCNAAPFLISRANEQVKVDVCYNNNNVKMFGLNSGASYGPLASTHHSLDDISVMRGFGNVEIYAPGCPIEARQIIEYAIRHTGPVYVRMDGKNLPELHDQDFVFKPGNVDLLRQGGACVVVALGSTVHEAVSAAALLAEEGIDISVVNLSSIRPLDKSAFAQILRQYSLVISIEEHNLTGVVGAITAEVLAENGIGAKLYRYGVKDGEYAIAGDRLSTREDLGIDAQSLVKNIRELSR